VPKEEFEFASKVPLIRLTLPLNALLVPLTTKLLPTELFSVRLLVPVRLAETIPLSAVRLAKARMPKPPMVPLVSVILPTVWVLPVKAVNVLEAVVVCKVTSETRLPPKTKVPSLMVVRPV